MDIARKLAAGLAFIATVAGLVALVADARLTSIVAAIAFAVYTFLVIAKSGLVVATLVTGFPKILDVAKSVLEKGKDQEIFVHAAFNSPDEVDKHPYMALTKEILRANKFDEYTRIVAIGSHADKRMTADLLREFGRSPRFRLGVYEYIKAFPLNILCVSPSYVLLGFPREPVVGKSQADIYALYVRSTALYQALRTVRTFLWNQAIPLSENNLMNDAQIEAAIQRLDALPLVPASPPQSTVPAQLGTPGDAPPAARP